MDKIYAFSLDTFSVNDMEKNIWIKLVKIITIKKYSKSFICIFGKNTICKTLVIDKTLLN